MKKDNKFFEDIDGDYFNIGFLEGYNSAIKDFKENIVIMEIQKVRKYIK